jgi:CRP/FNR family transcriptional regulator
MLQGAEVRSVAPRGTVYALDDHEPRAGILLSGTARAFLTATDGRQLTVRYARRGAFLGRSSPLLGGHIPVAVDAVTTVEILDLDARAFVQLLETDVAVSFALLAELSRRLEDVHATVADSAFGTVRERVARHLLALTDDLDSRGGRVTSITQQELADGVGTMREVVARALAEFRNEGLIATGSGRIEVLDPARLTACLGAWQHGAAGVGDAIRQDVAAMLDSSPNAIVAVNRAGVIRYVNSPASAMFGSEPEAIVGQKVETLIPQAARDRHVGLRADFLADPTPRPLYQRLGLQARRLDGTLFPVAVGLATVATRAGMLILATLVELPPD